jgi:peroxiredoxin Q/BCP
VRRRFGPLRTRRRTFDIGTDRRVIEVVRSELRRAVHADRALAVLRERAAA